MGHVCNQLTVALCEQRKAGVLVLHGRIAQAGENDDAVTAIARRISRMAVTLLSM